MIAQLNESKVMPQEDFKDDELIDVQLPRSQYKILKEVIQREEAYNWFYRMIVTNWIFIVAGGVLTVLLLFEKLQSFIGIK